MNDTIEKICAFLIVAAAVAWSVLGCCVPQPDMDTSTEQGRQRAIALSTSYQPSVATSTPTETAQQAWERRVRERIPCVDGEARTNWPAKTVEFICPTYRMTRDGPKVKDPWSWRTYSEIVF